VLVAATLFVLANRKSDFGARLREIENVSSVKRIWQMGPFVEEKYMVTFTQPLDWDNPSAGTFEQRVEVAYVSDEAATVYQCGGYALSDISTGSKKYMRQDDRNELGVWFKSNFCNIEYRFFGESAPKGLSVDSTEYWSYLTVENAAKDFNAIITAMNSILPGGTIFTGGSKGGYTTNTMAYFYPDLCDAYVAYVAPLCNDDEDERLVQNLYESIGDEGYSEDLAAEMRKTLLDFEVALIENREDLQGTYYSNAIKKGCKYRDNMTEEILFDMGVLDYGLGFWQYGSDFNQLSDVLAMPDTNEKEHAQKMDTMLSMFESVSDPASWSETYWGLPYYYQAIVEMGCYKLDFSYLREAVIEKTGKDMLAITEDMEEGLLGRLMFSSELLKEMNYDDALYSGMIEWSETTDAHVVMIYGGCDPWYAVRIPDNENENIHSYVVKNGCHTAAIQFLPEDEMQECVYLIYGWLSE